MTFRILYTQYGPMCRERMFYLMSSGLFRKEAARYSAGGDLLTA
jgi:hypothetical protein